MVHIKIKHVLRNIIHCFNIVIRFLTLFFPWAVRRLLLKKIFGFEIHEGSRIGFSWIFPKKLKMGPNAYIGHFNICKGLDHLKLGRNSSIGNLNWISAYPKDGQTHFSHQPDRSPELVIGDESSITNRHLIDSTNSVKIGRYTTVGGNRSQIMTHSINLIISQQHSNPIIIGEYCFVGSESMILGGSILPDYSVLGAKSLLNRQYTEKGFLYGGVPARKIKKYPDHTKYFKRRRGYVK